MTQPVHPAPRRSPYQGLEPYTEADYAYFFGRDQESTTIAANLSVARLTLFYGPSGVGKSSVLRAGVLHQLQQQAQTNLAAEGRPQIIPVYFKQWHDNPLVALTRQIERAAGQLDPALASPPAVADAALPPFATLEREGGLPPPTLPQHGGGTAIASESSLLPPQTGEGWGGFQSPCL